MPERILFDEDFSKLPLGFLPFLYTAHGEYHVMQPPGDRGGWYEATCSYSRTAPQWAVMQDGGAQYLEHSTNHEGDLVDGGVLVTGDDRWGDYHAEVALRLLSRNPSGLLVRYRTARQHIRVLLDGERLAVLHRDETELHVLGAREFEADLDAVHVISVQLDGDQLHVAVDGTSVLDVEKLPIERGKVGLFAGGTAEFHHVKAWMDEGAVGAFDALVAGAERDEAAARERTPQAVLLKRIDLHRRVGGRQLRIGDIDGDGRKEIVVGRCTKRGLNDNYNHIRSLTAVDLDGNVLWDYGVPGPTANQISTRTNHPAAAEILTADLPFQVYDLDGDGRYEVILYRHFHLIVLDGATGEERLRVPTPTAPAGHEDDFGRLNVDSIAFADLSGRGRAEEILIKNRYRDIWALDRNFEVLWTRALNTGHFPAPYDVDGDGKDEVIVGYTGLRPDGGTMFDLGITADHVDEIVIGRFGGEGAPVQIAVVAGNEGFMVWDLEGNILHREMLGHAQRLSAAPYRDDLDGVQFFTTTYWGEPGIVSFHDCTGRRLWFREITDNGQVICPADWSGLCRPLCLLSGSVRHGGMIDGLGRQVVPFPDDGHPELCADVTDLLGTGRDQVLLWDENALWIYGADTIGEGARTCRRFPPGHNRSNYRGEGLFPA